MTESGSGAIKYGMENRPRVIRRAPSNLSSGGGKVTRWFVDRRISTPSQHPPPKRKLTNLSENKPLLHICSKSPTFITIAFLIGVAGIYDPSEVISSTSRPPQSSWNNMVIELQSVWAGHRAARFESMVPAGMGG